MSVEVWAMIAAGVAALVVGLALVLPRFRAAAGAGRLIVLGPVFEAVALAMFAAEHFTAARELMAVVPKWLPGPLFWTYFFWWGAGGGGGELCGVARSAVVSAGAGALLLDRRACG